MKNFIATIILSTVGLSSFSQLTTSTYGGNKTAMVGERIGLTEVTIHYNRPGMKGREGKIWGDLVKEGFFQPDFSNNKATPWRAGANENTTISFSNDVQVEGKPLPAGTYGLFIAYGPKQSTVIFSKNSTSWGSYFYKEEEDALRVNVQPKSSGQTVEWMKFEFNDQTDSTATVYLLWDQLSIPFKITADVVRDQLNSFRKELRSEKGFNWQAFNQAAQWCLQHHVNLEEALLWSDSATSPLFEGDKEFVALSTKAQLLSALGRNAEADALMKKNLPLGNMQQIHQYGRQLLSLKKNKEALEVFKLNHSKNPGQFTSLMGLARAYSANGDYKTALKYAQQAKPLAPDPGNKQNVETVISKLKEGKDIN